MDAKSLNLSRSLLASYYARHKGPIAFIDESIRGPERPNEFPFYILSAVIVESPDLESIRASYRENVGGNFWHTTAAYRDGQYAQIRSFSDCVESSSLGVAISLQLDLDASNLELARRESFLQLASQLSEMGCLLAIYEQRNTRRRNSSDASLINLARQARSLPQEITFVGSKPEVEPLLWGPDLVSWCFRQILTVGQKKWFDAFSERSVILDASGMCSKNEKRPETAAARNSGPVSPAALFEGKAIRSSSLSMPNYQRQLQDILHKLPEFTEPRLPPPELKSWLRRTFPE